MEKLKKFFFEKRLELYDFPMDTQELSITVTSYLSDSEVKFIENETEKSTISTEVFLNQQEWKLFNFVKNRERTIYDHFKGYDRSGFTCSAFVARKPGYFFNKYFLK